MSFDQLISLLQKGGTYGFALFFAASTVIVGQFFGLWPFVLLSEAIVSYVLFGGAHRCRFGHCEPRFLRARVVLACWRAAKKFVRNLTVMGRVPNLLPRELAALFWIAHHPNENIYGSPIDTPFRGLCREEFLTRTDDSTLFEQAFRVNWQVYWRKKKLVRLFPKLEHLRGDVEAPWKARRWNV